MPSERQSKGTGSRGTLQRQGVPIPAKLNGPNNARRPRTTAAPTKTPKPKARQSRTPAKMAQRANANVVDYSPTKVAEKSSDNVGLLEAEYFGIIFILVAGLVFGSDSYGNKIMAFMKRGFLTSILFFFLALIAGIGNNANKVAKGLGALVFVAILVSTPGQDIISTLDNFFKQAWIGTGESATKASSDSGVSANDTLGQIAAAGTSAAGSASTAIASNPAFNQASQLAQAWEYVKSHAGSIAKSTFEQFLKGIF